MFTVVERLGSQCSWDSFEYLNTSTGLSHLVGKNCPASFPPLKEEAEGCLGPVTFCSCIL